MAKRRCDSSLVGGIYYCRICGEICSVGMLHEDPPASPIQKVQMAIEAVEEFFQDVPLTIDRRRALKAWFLELRKVLEIPQDKIYSRDVIAIRHRLLEYNPSDEFLKRASAMINWLDLIGDIFALKEDQRLQLKILMKNLRRQALKEQDKLQSAIDNQ